MRETGNLVFHTALLGVLVTVAIGGGFGFAGQRVVVEGGQSFVNTLASFDSFSPGGRFFDDTQLQPFRLSLEGGLDAVYETRNPPNAIGQPTDFTARVTIEDQAGEASEQIIKVNEPLATHGTDIYLLGNGYAPTITVRDPDGEVVFTDSVPFLPPGCEPHLDRRREGARRTARAARHDRALLPDAGRHGLGRVHLDLSRPRLPPC